MRISDWSSDVCSSDLVDRAAQFGGEHTPAVAHLRGHRRADPPDRLIEPRPPQRAQHRVGARILHHRQRARAQRIEEAIVLTRPDFEDAMHYRSAPRRARRSEEHTSELQSLMRISYAVFC